MLVPRIEIAFDINAGGKNFLGTITPFTLRARTGGGCHEGRNTGMVPV
jgi:hypothetical protein